MERKLSQTIFKSLQLFGAYSIQIPPVIFHWKQSFSSVTSQSFSEFKSFVVSVSSELERRRELESLFLLVMDQMANALQKQIQAILRVLNVTSSLKEDKIPCLIEQGLFLGSMGAAINKDALKSRNITHILTVANALVPAHPNDFVYKVIGVADKEDTNLSQYFDECINFIDEAKRQGGGGVLVHCLVGRSRSVTIVVAYLMKKCGMSLSQAMEHVKSRRPQAAPNSGFILQLQDFEKSLQGQI